MRTANALARAAGIADLRRLAQRRLPRMVFDFIDGGAGDERTLRDNEGDFAAWRVMPRVGVDVGARDPGTRILGRPAALPLILAPTGLAGMFAPKGEACAARAAADAGIPFCLSTNSVPPLEEVARDVPDGDRWFQLYTLRDRACMWGLLDRAAAAGYRVLCLTLDLPVQGRRERDMRNAFSVPLRPSLSTILDVARHPRWLYGLLRSPVRFGNFEASTAERGFTSIAQHVAGLFDPAADWETVAEVRRRWAGPMVVKGVLHPDDARRAADLGCQGVIISNHGGRQLDQVPSAVAALPAVADAVGGAVEVILDGGVRRGVDLVKARALGADACMIGRPFLWGLAAGGTAGVARTLAIFRDELDNALALLGQPRFAGIGPEILLPSAGAASLQAAHMLQGAPQGRPDEVEREGLGNPHRVAASGTP